MFGKNTDSFFVEMLWTINNFFNLEMRISVFFLVLIFTLLVNSSGSLLAQRLLTLDLKIAGSEKGHPAWETLPDTYSDSLSLVGNLQKIVTSLRNDAYLAASIDTILWRDTMAQVILQTGPQYEWSSLENGDVETVFLEQVGFRKRLLDGKPFRYRELVKIQEKLLNYAENNGYPFALVWLDDIVIKDGKIGAKIFMKKNRLIFFDKIKIFGNAKITTRYLENYLGIRNGELYSRDKVLKIKSRLRELPFVIEKQNATVTFEGDQATINLFIDKKNASRFDFLVGLQPRSQSSGPNNPEVQTFQLTGTFNADLNNQFGRGEKIYAEFQQLRPQTQELNVELGYPYILDTPFGMDLKFDLYKRDTAYLDIISDLGVQYLFEAGTYLRVFWNRTTTNVLSVNESQILQTRRLPTILDISRSSFGLEYQVQKLNYRFNPSKGWMLNLRGGAGLKRINKNNKILELASTEFDPEILYDTINLQSFQYQLSGQAAYYFPLSRRTVLKTGIRGGYIIADSPVYQNEQFRIGGNRILRGFDEESIFVTNYAVATLELRLLLGQNSYLFAFGDLGYTENIRVDQRNFDRPAGMGAGITFETKVGLFGFSLAVGKQQNTGFDFRSVKTHFGYVSLF